MPTRMDSVKNEIGIQCLTCGKMQLPPNREQLDNWNCNYCYGGFLTLVMLGNLVPKETSAQLHKRQRDVRPGRSCPKCRMHMEIVEVIQDDHAIDLDLCRRCHLVWFDPGELTRLARKSAQEEFVEKSEYLSKYPKARPVPKAEPEAPPLTVPFATIAIFVVCAALMPVAVKVPEATERFAFLPWAPWRGGFVPALTSLFLNLPSQMHFLLPFALFGSYAEKRLGPAGLVKLFVLSGLAGRFVHALAGGETPVLGASEAVAGVVAYGILTAPLFDFLYPRDRWRSPRTAVSWWLVILGTVACIIVSWEFFHMAFARVGRGQTGATMTGTYLGSFKALLATTGFKAHLFGASMAVLMLAGEAFRPPQPRVPPTAG